jgi:hypothetical protein
VRLLLFFFLCHLTLTSHPQSDQAPLANGILVVDDSTPEEQVEEIELAAPATPSAPAQPEPEPPKPFEFNPALDE